MASWAALWVAAALSASPAEIEKEGLSHVVREFERIGRNSPIPDPPLTLAARALAAEALRTGADQAADLLAIAQAVSDAGGFDPTPRAVLVRATPPRYALDAFLKRKDFNEQPATHVGVGAAVEGDRAVVVALLSERKARLEPFPRALKSAGEVRALCGLLDAPLRDPEVFVTRPRGTVDRVPVSGRRGRFCSTISFPGAGRHALEIIARGDRGPEVAAMFFVDAGAPPGQEPHAEIEEPATLDAARAALLVRINGLRQAHGLAKVAADARLDAVAQAHSERMAREHFFAHVAPDGQDVRQRLAAAHYAYSYAGENLGLAAGPLAAHFAIEHSPGHRRTILDEGYTAVGLGVAREKIGERAQVVVTEVFAKPTPQIADPIAAAYRALGERRAAHGLPPLKRNAALESIARAHARRALQLGQPRIALPGRSIHEQVFESLDVKSASVDFFVSDDPASMPDSQSIADGRNDLAGIGAVKGDSPTYGQQKYWVVVIYASSH